MSPAAMIEVTKGKAKEAADKVAHKASETLTKVEKNSILTRIWNFNRNMTLATVGAVALIGDQINDFSKKSLERGETFEREMVDYARQRVDEIKGLIKTKKAEETTTKTDDVEVEDNDETVDVEAEEKAEAVGS